MDERDTPMSLVAVGLDYRSAPIDLREKLAVPRGEIGESVDLLMKRVSLQEVMLLSTCNRVEIYAVHTAESRPDSIIQALAEIRGVSGGALTDHTFIRNEHGAARHIFRVAASLESMVVGEPQILGQVKEAYQLARERGAVGAVLDRCLTMAFKGAKKVRTETDIARGGASVASVAVDLAHNIFGDLRSGRVLIVGAGEMAEAAAVRLRAAGVGSMTVVNRSEGRGRTLAKTVGGRYEEWSQLESMLSQVDIVVASTGAREPIIDRALMRRVMKSRRGEPMFLVDIAVPRDVDPAVGSLESVFLYDVDDLRGILDQNMHGRAISAEAAGAMVDEEVSAFLRWNRSRNVAPIIRDLRSYTRDVVEQELSKALARIGDISPAQREAVEGLGHSITQKLLHRPTSALREAAGQDGPQGGRLAEATTALFGLKPYDDPHDPGDSKA